MPILLAFACAVVYGVADYCGGRASRSATSTAVSLVGQATSLVLVLAVVFVMGTAVPSWHDWAWGGAAGVATAVALGAFYHALSHGAMTVVAPITAVTSAAIPVAVGLVSGERPGALALVGMALAVVAVSLVSGAVGERHTATPPVTLMLAFVAGAGFAVIFVTLDRTSHDSGMWPLVSARIVSVALVGAFVLAVCRRSRAARDGSEPRARETVGPSISVWRLAMLAGALDMTANVFYVLAVRRGLLSVVVVVAAMYPVSTVCLAFGLDRERVSRSQALGMGLAVGALVLISLAQTA